MDLVSKVVLTNNKLDTSSYYELLEVPQEVESTDLQNAFHRFALIFHPDQMRHESDPMQRAAKRVYIRGVEAYTVLRDSELRSLYDTVLEQGNLRLTETDRIRLSKKGGSSDRPPKPEPDFATAAKLTTDVMRQAAGKAELLIIQGRYPEALWQLRILESQDPDNEAIKARIRAVAEFVRYLDNKMSSGQ